MITSRKQYSDVQENIADFAKVSTQELWPYRSHKNISEKVSCKISY